MYRAPLEFLRHIQDELNFLERYCSPSGLADLVANPAAARVGQHTQLAYHWGSREERASRMARTL